MSVTGWVSAQIWPNTECLGGDLGYWRQQRRKLQSHQECRTRHFGAFSFWRFSEGAGFGERDGVGGGFSRSPWGELEVPIEHSPIVKKYTVL